jgi:hypothetical protein
VNTEHMAVLLMAVLSGFPEELTLFDREGDLVLAVIVPVGLQWRRTAATGCAPSHG